MFYLERKIAAKFSIDDFQDMKKRLGSSLIGDWIENLNILRNNYFMYFLLFIFG